jgi:2-succinyl-6-hydroxy-2,4-cyclohexadiene-1-carboxylate synthase
MLAHEWRGSGEPVTLLHGFMQDRRSWFEVLELLPEGFGWLLVDLPGHGGSVSEPATMDAAAAALAALWDELGVSRTHLAGYSLGGRLALYTALRHPRRLASLFTLGAHAGFAGAAREVRLRQDLALADEVESKGIEWFARYWAEQPLFAGLRRRGSEVLDRLERMRLAQDPHGIAAALRGLGAAAVEPFWDDLSRIDCPATFAAGAEDRTYVEHAERLRQRVKGSSVAVITGAGHAAHLEQPEAFAAVFARHLSTR